MAKQRIQVMTLEFRLCFPNLFEPSSFEGSDKQTYNCVMVFPKSADLSALKAAAKQAVASQFNGTTTNLRNPFRDGDEKAAEWGDVFKDAVYIRASTQFQPAVVDRKKMEILDANKVYSGCYARAIVSPYAYDMKGNKGVAFGLDAVQILRDGERLATGGSQAVNMFSAFEDTSFDTEALEKQNDDIF